MPYRDAALTRLLKPAPGGRCATQMLVCLLRRATPQRPPCCDTRRTSRLMGHPSLPGGGRRGGPDGRRRGRRRPAAEPPLRLAAAARLSSRLRGGRSAPAARAVRPRFRASQLESHVDRVRRRGATAARAHVRPGRLLSRGHRCPGMAAGDRQDLSLVSRCLPRRRRARGGPQRAAALVGSSQGACAVFNAALEVPPSASLVPTFQSNRSTAVPLLTRPVAHWSACSPCRPRSLAAAAAARLEDASHPVSVGRTMRALLLDRFTLSSPRRAADAKRSTAAEVHPASNVRPLPVLPPICLCCLPAARCDAHSPWFAVALQLTELLTRQPASWPPHAKGATGLGARGRPAHVARAAC